MHQVVSRSLLSLLIACPGLCAAQSVQVPVQITTAFIETLLNEQVFTTTGNSLRLNDDGSGCQFLELTDPHVTTSNGQILLLTSAVARSGRLLGGRCMLLLNWSGKLEFTQAPAISADGRSILLNTTSWRALRPDGQPDTAISTIGGWLQQYLPQNLRQTPVNLTEPLQQLQEFLALMLPPQDTQRTGILLDSLRIEGVRAADDAAIVTLTMDVPPAPAAAADREPQLSRAELTALAAQLDDIDAFITNTIKTITDDSATVNAEALLTVLLELRLQLLEILGESQRQPVDPARRLFVDAWNGLVPVLRNLAQERSDQASALRYLSFISAGDALLVLDGLGPAAGIDISADGLRRLARILIPQGQAAAADPLQHSDTVDSGLRESLGFGPPIPPPQFYNESSILDWLIPKAYAATGLDSATITRLNNWVPKTRDMDVYLPMVRDVLRQVVSEQLRSNDLESEYHEVFRYLVFATAWQESCWRQFVAKDAKRVPMQSGTGDVGMMQINPKVWRGLYDLQGLRWDIVYNARAGADILEHHLINYAIRNREHRSTGELDSLARSAYAAYNGGPRQYDRYRRADAPAYAKKVDSLFNEKYRELKRGRELAVMACYQG